MFDWTSANATDRVGYLGLQLQSQTLKLRSLEQYLDGRQPLSFVSPDVAEQLQNRIQTLNINYCKLLTDNLTQRLTVTGFKLRDSDDTDARLWGMWKANNLVAESKWLIRDFIGLGRAYATCWAGTGHVAVTVESPREMTVYRDPITREIRGALKQWSSWDGVAGRNQSWSVLYEPDWVTTFSSESLAAVNSIPNTNWHLVERVPNPLGTVPVVEFSNKTHVLDWNGTSEFESILSLQDAINKVALDSLVTSEFYSFARRWITGFSVPEGSNGEPLEVFGTGKDAVWTAESAEARMGEFQAQSLQGFDTLSNLLVNQISAVSGLPQYLCGVGNANPQSVDAINAAELSLAAKAAAKIDVLSPAFAQLGALMLALRDGRRAVDATQIEPVFADLRVQNPATQTDAFTKLVAAGVPLRVAAKRALGWTDAQAAELPETEPANLGNENDGTQQLAA